MFDLKFYKQMKLYITELAPIGFNETYNIIKHDYVASKRLYNERFRKLNHLLIDATCNIYIVEYIQYFTILTSDTFVLKSIYNTKIQY